VTAPPDASRDDLVTVLATSSDAEASVVRALLESHGVPAIITSDKLGALVPLRGDDQPTVRVRVAEVHVADARQIIEASRDAGDEDGARDDAGLDQALDYRFRDRGLLEHALTHRSRVHEDPSGGVADNESLEFLGDAVLGFVVADLLFREFPEHDEGGKSKMKASLVSTATLAERGAALGLGDFLLLGKGEARSGGRAKQALLADAYEAVIAAIYLDGGIDAARAFIEQQLAGMIDEFRRGRRPEGLSVDYKSALQEWAQAHGRSLPAYTVVGETGPDHEKVFVVAVRAGDTEAARAEGRSKKEAEQRAAALALEALRLAGG
jgi:ribonuclease-3|tara:strand:- start:631 stop:1599 length:969 start_codon:yes stop_codon:yes gene_type:complete